LSSVSLYGRILTSVKMLPHRPPVRLIRVNYSSSQKTMQDNRLIVRMKCTRLQSIKYFHSHEWSKHTMWLNMPQLKLINIQVILPIFKTMSVAKNIWKIINTISSIWHENMLGYLSLDITSSKLCSWKTACFSEQIMSADKYPSIVLHQMEAIAYLSLSRTFPKRNTSKLWQLDKILGWTNV